MVEHFLINFSETHRIFIYLIIFFGMFVEGEIILILTGILIRGRHGIHFLDAFLVAFAAVILHDITYWYIGKRLLKTQDKKFLFFNLEKAKAFLDKIGKVNYLHIFISKFGFSINRFTLIASGYFKMPLKKIIKYSIPADFVWTLIMISLGFWFAYSTAILRKDLKIFAISVTILLVVVIAVENLVQKAIREKEEVEK